MLFHGGQHGLGAGHVIAVILQGVGNALTHQGVGGEVDDAVDIVLAEHLVQERGVPQVAHIELPGALNGLPVAGAQVVHHHNVVALFRQQSHHVAADIAGAAGNENGLHIRFLLYFMLLMNLRKAVRPSSVHL